MTTPEATLTAISPVDGRYARQTEPLRAFFSEFALIKHRVLVEIEWFKALSAHPGISEVPALSQAARQHLDEIAEQFPSRMPNASKPSNAPPTTTLKPSSTFLKNR